MILTIGLALAALVAVVVGLRRRHRTVYLQMSEDWRRAHAADPLPDHLR